MGLELAPSDFPIGHGEADLCILVGLAVCRPPINPEIVKRDHIGRRWLADKSCLMFSFFLS